MTCASILMSSQRCPLPFPHLFSLISTFSAYRVRNFLRKQSIQVSHITVCTFCGYHFPQCILPYATAVWWFHQCLRYRVTSDSPVTPLSCVTTMFAWQTLLWICNVTYGRIYQSPCQRCRLCFWVALLFKVMLKTEPCPCSPRQRTSAEQTECKRVRVVESKRGRQRRQS